MVYRGNKSKTSGEPRKQGENVLDISPEIMLIKNIDNYQIFIKMYI
jgi:hypothetical protein